MRSRIAHQRVGLDEHDRLLHVARAFLGGEDHRRARVDRVVAVEDAQRLRHVARREVLVHGQRVSEDRVVVQRRVIALRDHVMAELLFGRAELGHVPLREQPRPLRGVAGTEGSEELPITGGAAQLRHHHRVVASRGPAAIADPLGCCLMTRSASTVWQKPDDTAAIACTAEYANAGTIIPDAHQLRGSTPSIQRVVQRFGADRRDAVDVVHGEPRVVERGHRGLDHELLGRETGVAADLGVAETDDGDAISSKHDVLLSMPRRTEERQRELR